MAKNPSPVPTASPMAINYDLLLRIRNQADGLVFISQEEATPLLTFDPPLIEVNLTMANDGLAPAMITSAGASELAKFEGNPVVKNETNSFSVISGVELPKVQRGNRSGFGGAPKKYPFDDLEVGGSFYVAKTDEVPEPLKTLQSTASNNNLRYSEETGETETVTRVKRNGRAAALDADGQKIMETVERPIRRQLRKFVVREVKEGVQYGQWTAPSDGVIVQRISV